MEFSQQIQTVNQLPNMLGTITTNQMIVNNVADIPEILSYVRQEEQRPYFASILGNTITAKLLCQSPQYTVKPVDYLSSSELMVSTAQMGHILIDYFVRQDDFLYKNLLSLQQLREMRENHEIYFTSMEFSFRNKIPAKEYTMQMTLEGTRLFHHLIIASFRFDIGDSCVGSFKAVVNTQKP